MKRLLILSFSMLFVSSCIDKKTEPKNGLENKFYNQAYELRERKEADSAFLFFNMAKDLFLQRKDSLGAGKCLVNMGIIATNRGDYFGGQEISLSAIPYFNNTNKDHYPYINSNFNNLGIATYRLKDYQNSIKFYNSAIEYADDSSDIRLYLNNKGNSYRELKVYNEALKMYFQALKGSDPNKERYAQTLTNISFTKWLQNAKYNAAPDLLRALHTREKGNYSWGQNSSYAHLSDYYSERQPDSALFYAAKMYKIAKSINSPDDELTALIKLIRLSQPQYTKQYFESYHELADSLETSRSAAKNQFILIRYEAEKNKADNLNLQKDNTEKQYQIAKRDLLLGGAILLFIAGAIIIRLWYKKRKQKMEAETKNTIRENQLKTSKKVHDVVANGLYRTMAEIENQHQIDREGILDRLEEMYEKSRDISYEVDTLPLTAQNFHQKIDGLMKSFATPTTKVAIKGNSKELWGKVSVQVKHELEHILQELMVNMKKHSSASHVSLRFELTDNSINIYYADNGIGMPEQLQFKNGLTNTGNRIAGIDGTITFDTKVKKGLSIQVSFPIS